MPHTPFRKVVNTLLYLLITGCRWCDTPTRAALGLKECRPSVVAALAGGWHLGGDAGPGAGAGRGTRHDSLGVWRRGWRFFPLGRVGVRASPVAAKARECLIHGLTAGDGMPLAHRTTPANGDERAQVMPCSMRSRCGRAPEAVPANVSKSSPPIKGTMRKPCVRSSGSVASGRRSPSASGRPRTPEADRSKKWCPASKPSVPLPGSRRSIAAWWSGGSVLPHVSTAFLAMATIHMWIHRLIVG